VNKNFVEKNGEGKNSLKRKTEPHMLGMSIGTLKRRINRTRSTFDTQWSGRLPGNKSVSSDKREKFKKDYWEKTS